MKKGILISFEGGEGAGKTIQIKLLADWFRNQGRQVVITREPGGTKISEQIRTITHNPENKNMSFLTEALLFQAARAQIYAQLILPALKAGKVVVSDRSRDSSTVYQGMARGLGEKFIEQLNDLSTQKTYPDLTIYLDTPVEIGLRRRNGSDKLDRLDMETKEFYEKVREGYLKLAKRNDHQRWFVIDGSKTVEEIHQEIIKIIKQKFPERLDHSAPGAE